MRKFDRKTLRSQHKLLCHQVPNPLTLKPRYGKIPGIMAVLAVVWEGLSRVISMDFFADNVVLTGAYFILRLPALGANLLIYGIWWPKKRAQ